jgi:hypothetical protein
MGGEFLMLDDRYEIMHSTAESTVDLLCFAEDWFLRALKDSYLFAQSGSYTLRFNARRIES